MTFFWLSISGLLLLLFVWTKTLLGLLRDDDLPNEFWLKQAPEFDETPAPLPSLSVIVPARNEANNIEICVRSIMALDWPGALDVIVIDDRSTDGTSDLLKTLKDEFPALQVVSGEGPPEGWLGKPHALHLGQQFAEGDWLLFIDADVTLKPGGPQQLLRRTIEQGASFSSVLGGLQVESFWEYVIQTRIGALIAGANPLREVNDPAHERALANGQCLLFSRQAYDALGGHESIRGSVLDDVDFAKRAKSKGQVYRLYYGPDVFSCRMYRSLREIWQGWSKNLFPALDYSLLATAIITALIFGGSVLPFILLGKNLYLHLVGAPVEPWFLGLELSICVLILFTDGIGHARRGYPSLYFWTFPIGMFVITLLFWNSALRISLGLGTVWKGRRITRQSPHRIDDGESG